MKYLAACAFLLTYQAYATACRLVFPAGFQNISGRIAAIELVIKHGAIASLSSIPVGWAIKINNDPSWSAIISGHALVGAAFLQTSELTNSIFITPEPHYICSKFRRQGWLRLKLNLYENDRMLEFIVDHLSADD